MLKSPFVVHPKTGRVCIPIDPRDAENFDPFQVPTIKDLLWLGPGGWRKKRQPTRFLHREIDDYDKANPVGDDGGKKIRGAVKRLFAV